MSNLDLDPTLLRLAAQVLTDNPGAPAVSSARIATAYRDGVADVEFLIAHGSGLVDIARWAHALGTDLVLNPMSDNVRLTATGTAYTPRDLWGPSCTVEFWDLLDWPAALQAARRLGVDFDVDGGPLSLDPHRVFAAFEVSV